jgi:hypothetical protein
MLISTWSSTTAIFLNISFLAPDAVSAAGASHNLLLRVTHRIRRILRNLFLDVNQFLLLRASNDGRLLFLIVLTFG